MVSCDTCFLTLALVSAFLVVSMDARSWDIAMAIGNKVEFLKNGTTTGRYEVHGAKALTGLAYDSATQTMYMGDTGNNVTIYNSTYLSERDNNSYPMLYSDSKDPESDIKHILEMVFDPKNRTLFWTDNKNQAIMKMDVTLNGSHSSPMVLVDLENHSPHGIALDICNRFIYWTNSNESIHSIERMNLDDRKRMVFINDSLYQVYGLAVDNLDAKLYWADIEEGGGLRYKIERSDLDGNNRVTVFRNKGRQPTHLAVDNEEVYWTDDLSRTVFKIKKNRRGTYRLEELKSYYLSHEFEIPSIITRNNVGELDCDAISKRKKTDERDDFVLSTSSTESYINLMSSEKEIIPTTQRNKNCLNEGHYDESASACICKKGFTGKFCEIDVCHNYCVHGSCVLNAKGFPQCACDTLYIGDRCEKDICDGYCLNSGSCSVSDAGPSCKCENSHGKRCEYTTELDKPSSVNCTAMKNMSNGANLTICRCSELNETLEEHFCATEPMIPSIVILWVLIVLIGTLCIVVAVLSYHVNKLRRRPRIRKRIVVSKGGVTPLTSRPQVPADSCEITIENCCNMNICETPCFEPKLRATPTKNSNTKAEEKNSLLDSMEGADSC